MVNTLEKPAQWQSEFFVAWVGEADHEAALASDFKVTARPAAVALGALTMAGRNNQDVMAR